MYIILFDSNCVLCHSLIKWIVKHDNGRFKIAGQQSAIYNRCIDKGLIAPPVNKQHDTVYLLSSRHIYSKSNAVLHILQQCGKAGKIISAVIRIFPKSLRNTVYTLIATHRSWLNKKNTCPVPTQAQRERML